MDKFYNDTFRSSKIINEELKERKKIAITSPSNNELISNFMKSTNNKFVKSYRNEKRLIDAFDEINSIIFAGFDYFHYSNIGDMVSDNNSLIGMSCNIPILINEEHLYKLKEVIDCYDILDFIISKDNKNNVKYSIWYANTDISASLIPFKRENDDIYVDLKSINDSYDGVVSISLGEHNGIPYNNITGAKSYIPNEDNEKVKRLNFHVNSKK